MSGAQLLCACNCGSMPSTSHCIICVCCGSCTLPAQQDPQWARSLSQQAHWIFRVQLLHHLCQSVALLAWLGGQGGCSGGCYCPKALLHTRDPQSMFRCPQQRPHKCWGHSLLCSQRLSYPPLHHLLHLQPIWCFFDTLLLWHMFT